MLLIDLSNGVLHVQLNRPEKKNALVQDMFHKLARCVKRLDDPTYDARVLLLSAVGDVFCAGNDLAEFRQAANGAARDRSGADALMQALISSNAPLVAAVSGPAVGIGATMLLHFDFLLMTKHAQFRFSFVDMGIVPEAASSLLLVKLLGYQRAAKVFLLQGYLDAKQAFDLGISCEIAEPAALADSAMSTASLLAKKPLAAIRASKQLMREPLREAMKSQLKAEISLLSQALASDNVQERL